MRCTAARSLGLLPALAVLLAGCASPAVPASSPTPDGLPTPLQMALTDALADAMAEYDVPGAVAGVWLADGGSWTSAQGLADVEHARPASAATTWPLRSVTKSFTVTLLLQLVDEGRVSLDDTIDTYVAGVTDGDRITLRELAGMASGNADYTDEAFLQAFTADPEHRFTLDELNGFMLGRPAQFAPGTRHVYTNANTNLLGAVVEEVTGQSYAEALGDRILTPLGLTDTHYLADGGTWAEPHPSGYSAADPTEPSIQNFTIFGPAGGMVSTLEDGRVWSEALAQGSLLEPATQAERLRGAPLDAGPPYDRYALGIGETDVWWGHNGEGLGFTAAVFHDPASGASIVVFMNQSNRPDHVHPADQTFRRLAAVLADEDVTGSAR